MNPYFGFSTGAIARNDFARAVKLARKLGLKTIELLALRLPELTPLVAFWQKGDWSDFSYLSIHAPSNYPPENEPEVLAALQPVFAANVPVVVHPNVIYNFDAWAAHGSLVLLENMDCRKPIGRTCDEMSRLFEQLPQSRFCFDFAHARQIDPSMADAYCQLQCHGSRLAHVHLSDLNHACKHIGLNYGACLAYSKIVSLVDPTKPIILETMLALGSDDELIQEMTLQIELAEDCFARREQYLVAVG